MCFKAVINNQSNKPIKSVVVKLVQTLRFHATSKTRTDTRDVVSLQCPNKVGARDFYTWNGRIKIPPVCPSLNKQTNMCKIIEIDYYIDLHVDVSTMSVSRDILIPLTIGTVPLQDPSRPEASAPTYESCMYGAGEYQVPLEDSNGRKGEMLNSDEASFAPVYPFYKFD